MNIEIIGGDPATQKAVQVRLAERGFASTVAGLDSATLDSHADPCHAGPLPGRKLIPHDGCTEWSVCGKCGELIDWASQTGNDRDDTTCPHCGHGDTAYLYADGEYTPLPMYTTPDGAFEYGYIRSPRDVIGRIEPFAQGWHVQRLNGGESSFEGTRAGVFGWIAEWYDIGDTPHPVWLAKELEGK